MEQKSWIMEIRERLISPPPRRLAASDLVRRLETSPTSLQALTRVRWLETVRALTGAFLTDCGACP